MRIPDFISGLLIFALAVGALIMALNFPQAIGQTLGPGTFPVVISSVLAIGGALLVVGSVRRRFAGQSLPQDAEPAEDPNKRGDWLVMAVIVAMPLFYVLAVDHLGFLLTSFLVLFITTQILWGGVARVTLFSLVSVLFVDAMFRGVFGIPLEPGLIYIPWW